MPAQRSLTVTPSDELTQVPAHARNHGIVAVLSTPIAEDAAELLGGTDARDLTHVNFYVDGEWQSETTYVTPRGDTEASERFDYAVKATLVRLRTEALRFASRVGTPVSYRNAHGESGTFTVVRYHKGRFEGVSHDWTEHGEPVDQPVQVSARAWSTTPVN